MCSRVKSKVKIILDISMLLLFLLQMAYHLIGNTLHERLGMALFIMLMLHNILDWKWYAGLRKGSYTPGRWFHMIMNFLLLISCFTMMVSAILLSSTLSVFLHLQATMFGRKLHMMSTSWSFVFLSAHVGLHWNMVVAAIKKQEKQQWQWLLIVARFSVPFISAYGLYSFLARKIPQRMFLLTEYAAYDYGESLIFCMISHVTMLCLFASAFYWIKKMMQ